MTLSRITRILAATFAVFVLPALTGCANKLTTPNGGISTLEGIPSDQIVLVGYQQPPLTESHWLVPTTENATPFFSRSIPMYPDSTGKLFGMVFDHTVADGMQVYRTEDGAGYVPIFDYTLRAFMKDLPGQRDFFSFQDLAASGAEVRWTARGSLGGRASHESPVSHEALASGEFIQTIRPTSIYRFSDSLGTVSWTPDPRAVFYIVDVVDFQEVGANRAMAARCQLPSPIYPDPTVTQTVLLTDSANVSFDVRGRRFPQRFLLRVAAVDANFHVVNRLNPGAQHLDTQAPVIGPFEHTKFVFFEEGPPGFNAFSVLPMGGLKVVFDPFGQDVGARPSDGDFRVSPASWQASRHGVVTRGLTGAHVRDLAARRLAQSRPSPGSRAGIAAR